MQSAIQSRFLSFSASADPANALFYYALAFNIFLSSIVSAKLADTPTWEIFGIPADTLSNLTSIFSLVNYKSNWLARLVDFSVTRRTLALGFQCVDFCVNNNLWQFLWCLFSSQILGSGLESTGSGLESMGTTLIYDGYRTSWMVVVCDVFIKMSLGLIGDA